ncbi:hypothetical protein [uncultured Desulfobacter sp.]|uniref:hypothetical protein n=1 Tax=uncultured Desulfobacter sp. TaxID=240139 RepID=UPI0029F5B051|nr:hypothetical protein [uncultured Desulfobacter sp.]
MKKAEDCNTVNEVYACLKELEDDPRLIRNAQELEQVEREILGYTNRLTLIPFNDILGI